MASKKSSSKSNGGNQPVHTEATATLLAFSNPPTSATPGQIARDCVTSGLNAIGIHGPFSDSDKIDFGAIDRQSCIDFGDSVVICIDGKGFIVPSLSGTFVILHEKGTVITFGNLVAAITKMMTPKGEGA